MLYLWVLVGVYVGVAAITIVVSSIICFKRNKKSKQEKTNNNLSPCEHGPVGLRGPIGRMGAHTPAVSEAEFLGRAVNYLTLAVQDLHGDKEALGYAYIDMETTCEEILSEYKMFLEKTKNGEIDKNSRYSCPAESSESYSFHFNTDKPV